MQPADLSNLLMALTWIGGLFIIALWISLTIWTYKDIQKRSSSGAVKLAAVLAAFIFFIPGVLIYLLVRPAETQNQEYQRTLEEEALLQSLDDFSLCPGCNRHIEADWRVCPSCHTQLKKVCHKCGRLMELPWDICPYCETPLPGMHREKGKIEDQANAIPAESDS